MARTARIAPRSAGCTIVAVAAERRTRNPQGLVADVRHIAVVVDGPVVVAVAHSYILHCCRSHCFHTLHLRKKMVGGHIVAAGCNLHLHTTHFRNRLHHSRHPRIRRYSPNFDVALDQPISD